MRFHFYIRIILIFVAVHAIAGSNAYMQNVAYSQPVVGGQYAYPISHNAFAGQGNYQYVGNQGALQQHIQTNQYVGNQDALQQQIQTNQYVGNQDALQQHIQTNQYVGSQDALQQHIPTNQYVGSQDALQQHITTNKYVGNQDSLQQQIQTNQYVGNQDTLQQQIQTNQYVVNPDSLQQHIQTNQNVQMQAPQVQMAQYQNAPISLQNVETLPTVYLRQQIPAAPAQVSMNQVAMPSSSSHHGRPSLGSNFQSYQGVRSGTSLRGSPVMYSYYPGSMQHSLGGVQHNLGGVQHNLGGMQHSLVGMQHSLGSMQTASPIET